MPEPVDEIYEGQEEADEADSSAARTPAMPRRRSAARKKIRAKTLELKAAEEEAQQPGASKSTARKGLRRGIRLKNLDENE